MSYEMGTTGNASGGFMVRTNKEFWLDVKQALENEVGHGHLNGHKVRGQGISEPESGVRSASIENVIWRFDNELGMLTEEQIQELHDEFGDDRIRIEPNGKATVIWPELEAQ